MDGRFKTVVETAEFIKKTDVLVSREIVDDFINFIAANPEKGDIVRGTGGVRKIRWAAGSNRGKSGGIRVIYYYGNPSMPIFLFTAYAKNQCANISEDDKHVLKKMITEIVNCYEVRR